MVPLLTLIFAPPVSVILLLMVFGRGSLVRLRASSAYVPLASLYLAPLLVFCWGLVMRYSGPVGSEPTGPLVVLLGMTVCAVFLFVQVLRRSGGLRLFAAVALLPVVWLGFWAEYVAAGMLTNA